MVRWTAFFLFALFAGQALAEDRLRSISLSVGLVSCLAPVETYPYRLDKTDPLYQTAREDHWRHLDEMEDYVNCLDRERGAALEQLRASFDLFLENFGEDAVLDYAAERGAEGD